MFRLTLSDHQFELVLDALAALKQEIQKAPALFMHDYKVRLWNLENELLTAQTIFGRRQHKINAARKDGGG